MEEIFRFHGLDSSDDVHDPKNLKEHIRLMDPWGYMYAASDHIGVQENVMTSLHSASDPGWGVIHEIGHRLDLTQREYTEVTNNMLSMHMNAYYNDDNLQDRINYNYLAQESIKQTPSSYESRSLGDKLGMFWQLEMYSPGYWAKLDSLFREEGSNITDEQSKKDTVVEYSSKVLNENLTNHFEKLGFIVSDEMKSKLEKEYTTINKKTWYLNNDSYKYEGNGIQENHIAEITNVSHDGNITIASNINQNDLLGYEIYKKEEIIGFTTDSKFTDINIDPTKKVNYSVVAYAHDLSQTKKSSSTSSYKPTLKVNIPILYIGMEDTFKPLEYVSATNNLGEDISDKIEYTSNINMNKRGKYQVHYSVTSNGYTSTKELEVEVVSKSDYASDIDYKSASSSWSNVKKDKSVLGNKISLRNDDDIVEFDKGIGTHAHSEIVYDLKGKGYDYFSSMVGIDQEVGIDQTSSVEIQAYVDNKKVYDSGMLTEEDNFKHILIDLDGAKELKLVATNGGNGQQRDHVSFGDAKFMSINTKPTLEIPKTNIIKTNTLTKEEIIGNVVAKDIEDKDLSQSVVVTGDDNINPSKSGKHKLTYTVTDSDNNKVSKTRNIELVAQIDYASDLKWKSATSGWSTPKNDTSVMGNKLVLKGKKGNIEFDKGIGTHSHSEIVYDIKDKGYTNFEASIGVDQEVGTNQASSVQFKIYGDNKELYSSDIMTEETQFKNINVNIEDVKELKLVLNNASDGTHRDHGDWANARFTTKNSKPTIYIDKSISTKVSEPVKDLIGNFSATDFEDGDLTSKVKVEVPNDINFNKPGEYNIKYFVTDSDNNTVVENKKISITNMNDFKYLTEYDWTSATQSYGKTQKNLNVNGNTIKLTDENSKEVSYEKGIGMHSNGEVVYDLSDKNYEYFSAYIGVDREMYNSVASISFEVHLDNEKVYDSGLMTSKDKQKYIEIPINDAKELKLVVKDGQNGIGSDHGSWGDTKLHYVNKKRADITSLTKKIEEALSIDKSIYSKDSYKVLEEAITFVKDLLQSEEVITAKKRDNAIKNIDSAINNLVDLSIEVDIPDETLYLEILRTLNKESDEKITLKDMHSLTSLTLDYWYTCDLSGIENAINLETINIANNEITDISILSKLPKLKTIIGNQNYTLDFTKLEDDKHIIELKVVDLDGKLIIPHKIVSGDNIIEVKDVLNGNKLEIDKELVQGFLDIEYKSSKTNYDVLISYLLDK